MINSHLEAWPQKQKVLPSNSAQHIGSLIGFEAAKSLKEHDEREPGHQLYLVQIEFDKRRVIGHYIMTFHLINMFWRKQGVTDQHCHTLPRDGSP